MADDKRKAYARRRKPVTAGYAIAADVMPPARLLAAVGLAGVAHLASAWVLLWSLDDGRPGAIPALLSVIVLTLAGALLLAARARHEGLDVATRNAPAAFGLVPPLASVAVALPWIAAASSGDLRSALLDTFPVLVATTAAGIGVGLVLQYSLWTVVARVGQVRALARRAAGAKKSRARKSRPSRGSGADSDASPEDRRPQPAPPSLAGRLARLVMGLGIASTLLILASALVEFGEPLRWLAHPDTWLWVTGSAVGLLLSILAAMSAGRSPGRDVEALALRLDAIGWDDASPSASHSDVRSTTSGVHEAVNGSSSDASGSRSSTRPLAAHVRVTSFDAIGELFANLERLRARLAADFETYRRALAQTQAADAGKREFLAAVSQELRTPLDAILDDAQQLLASDLSEAQAEDVRLIIAGRGQLRELIEDILDLSMIESGELELRLAECDLGRLVDELVDIHRAQVRGPRVELIAEHRGPVPLVTCDRRRIGQVLTNLLSNAIKFTEAGRVAVCVRVDPERPELEIAVTDTGVGIARAELTTIFEEYRQVGARKRKLRGTGLGLAIARQIAEAHDGSLVADSELGVGSTFTLRLPLTGRQPAHRAAEDQP